MDPKDAIPAAVAYLKAGGTPDDWYAALFTYNRAGWYVKEVLAIAENYRRIHGDDTVGPYPKPVITPTPDMSSRFEPTPRPEDVPVSRRIRRTSFHRRMCRHHLTKTPSQSVTTSMGRERRCSNHKARPPRTRRRSNSTSTSGRTGSHSLYTGCTTIWSRWSSADLTNW